MKNLLKSLLLPLVFAFGFCVGFIDPEWTLPEWTLFEAPVEHSWQPDKGVFLADAGVPATDYSPQTPIHAQLLTVVKPYRQSDRRAAEYQLVQQSNGYSTDPSDTINDTADKVVLWLTLAIGILELFLRVNPNWEQNTPVGKVLKWIYALSEFLNRNKPAKI